MCSLPSTQEVGISVLCLTVSSLLSFIIDDRVLFLIVPVSVFQELEAKTFEELTGCDPDILQQKAWDAKQQAKAGCSPEYIAALAKFTRKDCVENVPQYTPASKCPPEEALLHGEKPPTALELRAFLQQTQGFMPQYTGYSYTANEYDDPLSQEFWIHNDERKHLRAAKVAKLWNDTKAASERPGH